MTNYTYSPLPIVVGAHDIAHLDSSLQRLDGTFDLEFEGVFWNEYTRSLLPVPLIIFTLGFIATIVVAGILLDKAYFQDERDKAGGPEAQAGGPEAPKWQMPEIPKNHLVKLLVSSLLLALIATQTVFIGNSSFMEGARTTHESLGDMNTRFTDLHSYGLNLKEARTTFNANLARASFSCQAIRNQSVAFGRAMFTYEIVVRTYTDFMEPIPENIETIDGYVYTAEEIKDGIVWPVYLVVMCTLVLYALNCRYHDRKLIQASISVGEFLNALIMFLCAAEMAIVMCAADFCMDPSGNVQKYYEENSTTYGIIGYYSTCSGTNPADEGILLLGNIVNELDTRTQRGTAQCPNTESVQNMAAQVTIMQGQVALIERDTECDPVHAELSGALEEGACVGMFRGVYTFWVGHNVTVTLLFITVATLGAMFYHYGEGLWFTDEGKQEHSKRETAHIQNDAVYNKRASFNPMTSELENPMATGNKGEFELPQHNQSTQHNQNTDEDTTDDASYF
jgi:hypothetical protein